MLAFETHALQPASTDPVFASVRFVVLITNSTFRADLIKVLHYLTHILGRYF